MRWMIAALCLAGCAGLAQEPREGDGGQCSCPPGPPGPQGPQGPAGPQGPKGEPGEDAGAEGETTQGWRSGSRLTPLFMEGSDGSLAPLGAFWDSELEMRCQIDAWGVCAPGGPRANWTFADPECTEHAVISDDKPPLAVLDEVAYRPGAELHEAFERRGEDCTPADLTGKRAFLLGAEVPLVVFTR